MAEAVECLNTMREKNLPPDGESYSTIICANIENNNMEDVQKYLKEIKDKSIKVKDLTYMNMIYSLALKDEVATIEQVI